MLKYYLAIITTALLLAIGNVGCTLEDDMLLSPVDSTDYLRVAEILREIHGDEYADLWMEARDPRDIVLVEDTIRLTGSVIRFFNGEPVSVAPNAVNAALGNILAYGSRHGTTTVIDAIKAKFGPLGVNMSAPVRTAGGRGVNTYVTAQSTYTNPNAFSLFLTQNDMFSNSQDIAYQDGDDAELLALDTLTVNWTINIGGSYSTAQRGQMAKTISPESGYGGTMYKLYYGKFTHTAGFVSSPPRAYQGGDGNVQTLLIEWRYTHSGATQTLTKFEVLNSNSSMVTERTGLNIELTSGKKVYAYHFAQFLGS